MFRENKKFISFIIVFICVLLMRANATKILYVRVGEMLNICSVGGGVVCGVWFCCCFVC